MLIILSSGNIIDMNSIINDKNDIMIYLDGFYQRYEYYPKYKDEIKKLFRLDDRIQLDYTLDDDCLVMHIRLDDYKNANGAYSMLPMEYYEKCIK
jgi:hypothetical protein